MTTGKTIALIRRTFVDKVMSLLFNMLSRLVITFLPKTKRLLISWLQSPSALILEPSKIKSAIVSPGDPGSVLGLGRSCREGNGNPLQYSFLEDPMDRGAWKATVHSAAESDTTEQLTLSLLQSYSNPNSGLLA